LKCLESLRRADSVPTSAPFLALSVNTYMTKEIHLAGVFTLAQQLGNCLCIWAAVEYLKKEV
jgi:hypothetical protein